MVMQKRFKVTHGDVFPAGAYLKGAPEPVMDFDAPKREDGSRPQQRDKESGRLMWQAVVLDADEEAGKRDTAVTVKFLGDVRPVPPENTSGLPWTPVEFVGLTALAYVDDSGNRPRIAWSFRAEDMVAPGEKGQAGQSAKPAGGSKAAA